MSNHYGINSAQLKKEESWKWIEPPAPQSQIAVNDYTFWIYIQDSLVACFIFVLNKGGLLNVE